MSSNHYYRLFNNNDHAFKLLDIPINESIFYEYNINVLAFDKTVVIFGFVNLKAAGYYQQIGLNDSFPLSEISSYNHGTNSTGDPTGLTFIDRGSSNPLIHAKEPVTFWFTLFYISQEV